MNPFGGTPRCPRCDKLVYAAEQAMGPSRKMYHRPCLTCASCSKRLDSYSLVEHDSEPYCKQCHLKNFSTRDLRHANLPQAPSPRSPTSTTSPSLPTSPGKLDLAHLASPKRDLEQDTPMEPPPQPLSFPPVNVPEPIAETEETVAGNDDEAEMGDGDIFSSSSAGPLPPPKRISIYSRRAMEPVYSPDQAARSPSPPSTTFFSDRSPIAPPKPSPERPRITSPQTSWLPSSRTPTTPPPRPADQDASPSPMEPPKSAPAMTTGFTKRIVPMSTGGRVVPIPGSYSPTKRMTQTFTGNGTNSPTSAGISPNYTGQGPFGTPKKITPNFTGGNWGSGGRVECPRCGKAVYHAEGVNAVGKRWHKGCLRCTECTTSLDSSRLTDRDGEPYCKACYSKLYGPQGSGYALLGKAG